MTIYSSPYIAEKCQCIERQLHALKEWSDNIFATKSMDSFNVGLL